jgi:dTDP-glucose 4,6-dehydratase/UDP-glucose 4-epimerase
MKILILGSCGFIGRHLVNHLLVKKYDIVGCDIVTIGETTYPYYQISVLSTDLEDIFSENQFDICINASGAANVSHSVLYPLSDFEANVFAVAKVLDIIRKQNSGCRYMHISSAAVYGNPATLPVKESTSLNPISPYGYHKLMSEIICKAYYNMFKIPVVIIRPFSIFGNGLRKQLLWDICRKLKYHDVITLYGTGHETRDFLHISDFIVLVETVFNKSRFCSETFNAASGKQTLISEIARIFEKYYDGAKKITFNGESKKGDPFNWEADIEEIKKLGFSPEADLEISITEYIKWFNLYNED